VACGQIDSTMNQKDINCEHGVSLTLSMVTYYYIVLNMFNMFNMFNMLTEA
jgi:hypothetical protein